jgi:asparagine synthase (glutamine-hydrolysing)
MFGHGATMSPALVKDMADTIHHRGPDDEGYYVSGPVGLGFRRLSIIDLKSGHQPLSNEDETVWIVFNGEIYNYQELRTFLLSKGHIFKTHSDTEVIVHLYEELGLQCVEMLRGMFAFAIWDSNAKTLFLARDRVGIKPLYYCMTDTSLSFASEIKALLADPAIHREIAPEVIDRFLTFLYLPGQETLLKGIRKLGPGHYLLVKDGKPEIKQYWDLRFTEPAQPRSAKDAETELLSLLAETVKLHMIADVPVGVLLSGGVDSTGVLSFAVNGTDKEISTFTVGFSGGQVADERPFARLAAERFGTKHHEITIHSTSGTWKSPSASRLRLPCTTFRNWLRIMSRCCSLEKVETKLLQATVIIATSFGWSALSAGSLRCTALSLAGLPLPTRFFSRRESPNICL